MAPQATAMRPKTNVIVDNPVKEVSTFEKLPLEIRLKIYNELLNANKVRQSPDQGRVRQYISINTVGKPGISEAIECRYEFSTALLRVCKKIYNEAYSTLYHNNYFIVVSTNSQRISEHLLDHCVASLGCGQPQSVQKFKEHILRLHINLPDGRGSNKPKVAESFILVANELPNFVRMLRFLKANNFAAKHKLHFRVESTTTKRPTTIMQQLVLEPFRSLKIGHGALTFTGAIDSDYAESLKASMAPEVNWVRGLAWETYNLMLSFVEQADEAFRLGKFGCARTRYLKFGDWWTSACEHNLILRGFDDEGFHHSWFRAKTIGLANSTLAAMREGLWDAVISVTDNLKFMPSVTSLDRSMQFHCRAIAFAARQQSIEALECLEQAINLDPNNKMFEEFLNRNAREPLISSLTAKKAVQTICSAEYREKLDQSLDMPAPLLLPCSNIAGERYILRHFGYSGDLLEKIEEKEPVNIDEVNRTIREMGRAKAEIELIHPWCAWIKEDATPFYDRF